VNDNALEINVRIGLNPTVLEQVTVSFGDDISHQEWVCQRFDVISTWDRVKYTYLVPAGVAKNYLKFLAHEPRTTYYFWLGEEGDPDNT
jgi:hypothetical protein